MGGKKEKENVVAMCPVGVQYQQIKRFESFVSVPVGFLGVRGVDVDPRPQGKGRCAVRWFGCSDVVLISTFVNVFLVVYLHIAQQSV